MGGGGGGGRGLSPDELKRLQEKAKKSLKDSGGTGKCNVFISFTSEDLDEVNLLRGQAKNENSDIEFNDWSLRGMALPPFLGRSGAVGWFCERSASVETPVF